MSLILDALKKLDRDRCAEKPGQRDLSVELLKAGESPRPSGLLPLGIALVATAAVAALAAFLLIGHGPRAGAVPAKAPASPVQASQAVPEPVLPAPSAGTDKPSTPQAVLPAAPPEAPSPAAQPGRAKKDGGIPEKTHAAEKKDLSAKAPARAAAAPATRPAVKISAIVWQEDPSERKAMINGRIARQGETVDGMKVLEIHPSHVKVSFEGKAFAVGMFD